MFDDVPVAVLGSVLKYIDNAGDEFVDNIRIAEHGNKKSERLYEEKNEAVAVDSLIIYMFHLTLEVKNIISVIITDINNTFHKIKEEKYV